MSSPAPLTSHAPADRSALGIFLVDDSDTFRHACQNALSVLPGIKVLGSAGDGAEALDLIQVLQPDLVILDISMPAGISGIEVARRLKLLKRAPAFIFLSLFFNEGYQIVAEHMGALAYINKNDFVDRLMPVLQALSQSSLGLSSANGNFSQDQEP